MAELGEDFDGLVKLERYRLTKEALVTYRPFLVIFAVVLTVVALLQIAIGAIYLGDCPAQPMIPIYLIGVGAGIVLTGIVGRTCPCLDKKYRPRNPILYVLLLFLIGWFMAGNIWVFRLYLPDMEHKHDTARYCHRILYLYAFWSKLVQYVAFALYLPFIIYVFVIRPLRTARRIAKRRFSACVNETTVDHQSEAKNRSRDERRSCNESEAESLLNGPGVRYT